MSGIRGVKNPMPTKPQAAKKGVFQQSAPATAGDYPEVKAAAHASVRKGPVARNNGLKG